MNSRLSMSEWIPVKGYEGLYEVNVKGSVRSLPRKTTKGKILKPYVNTNGYVYYCLCKEGSYRSIRAHVIMLEAFTDYCSRASELQIDHIDGNKQNNSLENLEVVTGSENMKRAFALGLETVEGVRVVDLTTGEIFDSYSEASRSIGGKKGVMVRRVCDGDRSHYRGHKFARYDDWIEGTVPKFKGKWAKGATRSLWA